MSVKKVVYHVWEDGFGIFDMGPDATHAEVEMWSKYLNEAHTSDLTVGGVPFEVVQHPGFFRKGAVVKETILESFFEDKVSE